MKSYLDLDRKTFFWACCSWVLPLFVSFFLINPETKEYIINFWVFKLLMITILSFITYIGYKKISTKNDLKLTTAHTFFLVNVLGDVLVLLFFLKFPITVWLTTIVSMYIVVIYGLYSVLKSR